ncbi:MAG: DUF2970 domain-containing protein [Pseudohongiellaceae bacterium]
MAKDSDDQTRESGDQEEHRDTDTGSPEARQRLPFWRMMLSVIQASFGVQSRENKERDFAQGSITGFIVAALIFTVLFVLILMFIVSLVTG